MKRFAWTSLAALAASSAMAQFTYDFENLSLGDLLGQDGWGPIITVPPEPGSMIIQNARVSPMQGSTKALLMQRVAEQPALPDRRIVRSLGTTYNSGIRRIRIDLLMSARSSTSSNLAPRYVMHDSTGTNQIFQPYQQNGGGPGAAANGFVNEDGLGDVPYAGRNLVRGFTLFPDTWYRFEVDLDWSTHVLQNCRIYDINDGNLGLPDAMGAWQEFQQRGDPKLTYYFNNDTFVWFDNWDRLAFRYTGMAGDPGTEYFVYDNFASTELVAVNGVVNLQDHDLPTGANERVVVEIRQGATILDMQAVSPDENGNFTFYTDLQGTFDIGIKGSHWLRTNVTGVVINSLGGTIGTVQQINGDVDGDNEVNLVDYASISAAFGTTGGEPGITPPDGGWDYNADLNRDNEINLVDIGIVAANFGQAGDE